MPERDKNGRYIPKGFRDKEPVTPVGISEPEEVELVEEVIISCEHEKIAHWPFNLCAECIRQGPIVVVVAKPKW